MGLICIRCELRCRLRLRGLLVACVVFFTFVSGLFVWFEFAVLVFAGFAAAFGLIVFGF